MKRIISAALLLVFAGRANAKFDCGDTYQGWASYHDEGKNWTAPLKSTSCSDPLTQLSSALDLPAATDNTCGPLKGYLAFSLDKYVVQNEGDGATVKTSIDAADESSTFPVGDGGSPVKVANLTKTWDATCPPPHLRRLPLTRTINGAR